MFLLYSKHKSIHYAICMSPKKAYSRQTSDLSPTTTSVYNMQESSQSQENIVPQLAPTGLVTTRPNTTLAAECRQEGSQQSELVVRKYSDPLLAANTNSSSQDYQLHTVRYCSTESRPGGDGESELVTGITIKLQASTAKRRPQFLQETNPLSSGVMLFGHFEVEIFRM